MAEATRSMPISRKPARLRCFASSLSSKRGEISRSRQMMGPCSGLIVLDFSWGMAGSLATAVLADFGAEVIKIEPPTGDPFRAHPAWLGWSRGKKSVVLNLKTLEERAQAHRLAKL